MAGSELLIRCYFELLSLPVALTYFKFEDASSSFSDGPHVVEDALYEYRGCFVCISLFYDASFSAVPLGLRKVGRFPPFSRSSDS